MDIYKLKTTEFDKGSDGKILKITELKVGIKNPDRVNVFVNNKFAFSLDISQVVDFHLKIGTVLSDEKMAELSEASAFGKLYQRTLEWVIARPHSEKECRDYLRRKIFEKKMEQKYIGLIIERLKDKKYLNDYKFAEWYAEYLSTKRNYSLRRVEKELQKKGIKREILDEVLEGSESHDAEKLAKIIAKKRARYSDDQKLIAYLVRQGFDFELVRELVTESSSNLVDE